MKLLLPIKSNNVDLSRESLRQIGSKVVPFHGSNQDILQNGVTLQTFLTLLTLKVYNLVNFQAIKMNLVLKCWSSTPEHI